MGKWTSAGKGRPLLPQVLCGLTLCFTMLIFAPVEMVTLNSTNFWFGVGDFLPVFLMLFAAGFVLVEAVYALLRRLPYAVWLLSLSLLFGVTLCLYIQGNFLTMSGEAITAGAPEWSELLFEMLANTAVWGGIIAASAVLSLIRPKLFLRAVSAASALVLVMEGAALLSLAGGHHDRSELTRIYCSDEEQFTVSRNGDVYVVMLDTFDTRFMDLAIEQEPEYAKVFEDFTFYHNAATSYPLTDTSFASFMTGELYLNQEPFFRYVRRAFRESRFFPVMIENGMTVQMYSYLDGMFSEEQMDQVSNLCVRDATVSDMVPFVRNMLCMLGYRYAPMAMQPFLFRDFEGAFNALQQPAQGLAAPVSNKNLIFRQKLAEQGITVDDSRRFFKFYLLQGAHAPMEMNRYGEPMGPGDRSSYEGEQIEQILGSFLMVGEFFDELKEAGAYDKATIIVMGDHGINTDDRYGICSPGFLVKYPGEGGYEQMRISYAPVSLLDMRATALYGAGLEYEEFGTPAHLWEGTESRERMFYNHKYVEPSGYEYYLRWITEFIVPQDATDLDAYEPSGRVYKEGDWTAGPDGEWTTASDGE